VTKPWTAKELLLRIGNIIERGDVVSEWRVEFMAVRREAPDAIKLIVSVRPTNGATVEGLVLVEQLHREFPELSYASELIPFATPIRHAVTCALLGKLQALRQMEVGKEARIQDAIALVSNAPPPDADHTAVRVMWESDTAGQGMIFTFVRR
jgi:hypothetical protein